MVEVVGDSTVETAGDGLPIPPMPTNECKSLEQDSCQ